MSRFYLSTSTSRITTVDWAELSESRALSGHFCELWPPWHRFSKLDRTHRNSFQGSTRTLDDPRLRKPHYARKWSCRALVARQLGHTLYSAKIVWWENQTRLLAKYIAARLRRVQPKQSQLLSQIKRSILLTPSPRQIPRVMLTQFTSHPKCQQCSFTWMERSNRPVLDYKWFLAESTALMARGC